MGTEKMDNLTVNDKVLFVDCDGTIRKPISDGIFISSPDDQKPLPGAVEAINHYKSIGYIIFGITNQGGVSAGHLTLLECIKIQQGTLTLFPEINSIFSVLILKVMYV
jgi:D-glycero-D-manno-heptose 1,7-bisphosphate phosphatase